MSLTSKKLLITEDQFQFFLKEGYLHLEGVVPEQQLTNIAVPIGKWVDDTIGKWVTDGLIPHNYSSDSFETRLNNAWIAAGMPHHARSPRDPIISPELFGFLREPVLIKLVQDLTESDKIAVHGNFNCRPKLQQQEFTDTPWHQDAQYFPASAGDNVITVWMPLVDVDATNSCLEVAAGLHTGKLYSPYDDPTGFVGIEPEDRKELKGLPIKMKRGDLLCFNEMLPHAALSNKTETVRWSVDFRYEALGSPNSSALQNGFICAHPDKTKIQTSYDSWIESRDKPLE